MHHDDAIEALAHNDIRLDAPERVRQSALLKDYEAWYEQWLEDPDGFWAQAAEELHWFERWTTVSDVEGSRHAWFIGGKTNLLHAESEHGEPRSFTYREVLAEVSRTANALKQLGVVKGDRVVIYMPLSPEGLFAMHACVRIGAIHSVVYAGMGSDSLRHRIEDCGAKVLLCADVTYRRGKTVPLKPIVDEALREAVSVEHVVILRREASTALDEPRELDFRELVRKHSSDCPAEHMDAGDTAFVLYTSGTTGKPKGVVHVHGGYAVGVHLLMRHYFDTREDDVWWSTSDIGWIVGHSYICYGPMMAGATQIIREGTPDYPDAGITWKLVERYAVTTMFTAPTAVRMFMRMGAEVLSEYDRSSLRMLYCAGEPFNPEAWQWAQTNICGDHGQVVDNYWQTEIAGPMLGTFPGMQARPGFVGKPMPGIRLKVVDEDGLAMDRGEGGLPVMEAPVQYMMRTIYNDPERYASYWSETLGGYVTGDVAVCDVEGYWAVLGRSDDVLNVAGHRIGTADVESALITHPAVVESAVIGLPDELKGERIKAFVVTKDVDHGAALAADLIRHVRESLGPIAQPSEIGFLDGLPKTRSGKIIRRLLKARELGLEEGDTSTLED
jgi:acetyl-CoA synthetase